MTENRDVPGRNSDDDVSAADRQALAAMFAALSADPPESDFSPLRLVQLGNAELRSELDSRSKRFRVLRTVLVAAVFAALVVLVVPRLIPAASPGQASASSSSSSAAASGQAPAAPAASSAATFDVNGSSAGGGDAAATKAPDSSAASSAGSSAASVTSAAAAPASSRAAASSAADATSAGSSSAAASSPASSGAASTARSTTQVCSAMPPKAIDAVRSSFPAGFFGPPSKDAGCALYGVKLPAAGGGGPYLAVDVTKAKSGACLSASEGAPCTRKAGSTDTYVLTLPGGETDVWVYGGGYEVYLRVDGEFPTQPTVTQLAAAGHAVVKALGP